MKHIFKYNNYTITIKKEVIEGESYYASYVKEFPDLSEYCETVEEARSLTIEAIKGLLEMENYDRN